MKVSTLLIAVIAALAIADTKAKPTESPSVDKPKPSSKPPSADPRPKATVVDDKPKSKPKNKTPEPTRTPTQAPATSPPVSPPTCPIHNVEGDSAPCCSCTGGNINCWVDDPTLGCPDA